MKRNVYFSGISNVKQKRDSAASADPQNGCPLALHRQLPLQEHKIQNGKK
jgi:hypothetical protein